MEAQKSGTPFFVSIPTIVLMMSTYSVYVSKNEPNDRSQC